MSRRRIRDSREPYRRLLGLALAVFVLALGVRAVHLVALERSFEGSGLFSLARGDAAHHWIEARWILDGDPRLAERIPWKGPGLSYLLAGLMTVVGRDVGSLRWAFAVLGAANCAGLVLLAARSLGPRWAAVAGALTALHGVIVLFDGELLLATPLVTLGLATLGLLGRHRSGASGAARHAAAGVVLGLAVLVHPVYLLPLAALAAWRAGRSWRHALLLVAAAAVTVAPVTLTNVFVRGQPVLVSWNGGINLYVANHPAFDQHSGNATSAWIRILETPLDAGIEEEFRRDRLYLRLTLAGVVERPVWTAMLWLRKLAIFFSPVEYANNIRLYELREHSPVIAGGLGRLGPLWWPFGLWAPAALIGAVLAARRPDPLVTALGVWSIGLIASVVLSFNTARYRTPLVFLSAMLVARALAAAWSAWRERRRQALAAGGCAYGALAAVVALLAVPQHELPPPLAWSEAERLAALGRFDEGLPWLARALEREPHNVPLRLAAAGFHAEWGRLDEERAHLRAALARPDLEPDLIATAHERLARSLARDGRYEQARRELEAAIAVGVDDTRWNGVPYFPLGLGPVFRCRYELQLARLELAAGRPDRAGGLVAEMRQRCPRAGRLRAELHAIDAAVVLAGGG